VPSVRRVSAAFAATAPVAVLLTGCVSTQTVASRARLVDARIIASQKATEVTQENPSVSVESPVVIRTETGEAIAVAVRNDTPRQLTDLPISVGVRAASGRATYLNSSTTLDYFRSHIAAVGPDATTEWVFTVPTASPLPPGRAFARVGLPQLHPTLGRALPSVAVALRERNLATGGLILKLSVLNRSVVPQYDVPVYAVALRNGRDVAAGETAIAHLGTHGTATTYLELLGSSHYDSVRLIASPTIFN
jgi:hypothetical protein